VKLTDADRLYLIADSPRSRWSVAEAVRLAVAAGVRMVQLREKALPDDAYHPLAAELRAVTASASARLLINARVHIAAQVGADGVHIPSNGSVADARRALGDDVLVGCSVHSLGEIGRAEEEGADFLTVSPVFRTASKPGSAALGTEGLAALVRQTALPVYALGGIRLHRVRACLDAGAFGVAVVSSIMGAEDVAAAVRAHLRALLPVT
jgi:thiamine-phosphate pyrophosphorylase